MMAGRSGGLIWIIGSEAPEPGTLSLDTQWNSALALFVGPRPALEANEQG